MEGGVQKAYNRKLPNIDFDNTRLLMSASLPHFPRSLLIHIPASVNSFDQYKSIIQISNIFLFSFQNGFQFLMAQPSCLWYTLYLLLVQMVLSNFIDGCYTVHTPPYPSIHFHFIINLNLDFGTNHNKIEIMLILFSSSEFKTKRKSLRTEKILLIFYLSSKVKQ